MNFYLGIVKQKTIWKFNVLALHLICLPWRWDRHSCILCMCITESFLYHLSAVLIWLVGAHSFCTFTQVSMSYLCVFQSASGFPDDCIVGEMVNQMITHHDDDFFSQFQVLECSFSFGLDIVAVLGCSLWGRGQTLHYRITYCTSFSNSSPIWMRLRGCVTIQSVRLSSHSDVSTRVWSKQANSYISGISITCTMHIYILFYHWSADLSPWAMR